MINKMNMADCRYMRWPFIIAGELPEDRRFFACRVIIGERLFLSSRSLMSGKIWSKWGGVDRHWTERDGTSWFGYEFGPNEAAFIRGWLAENGFEEISVPDITHTV